MNFKEEFEFNLTLLQQTQNLLRDGYKELQSHKDATIEQYPEFVNEVKTDCENYENQMQKKAAKIDELRQMEKDLLDQLEMANKKEEKEIHKQLKINENVKKIKNLVLKHDLCKITTNAEFDLASDQLGGYVKLDNNIKFFAIKNDENEDVVSSKLWKKVSEVNNGQ